MALEKMGLGGVLAMDVNQGVSAMGQASQAAQVLAQSHGQVPGAAQRAGAALDSAGGKAAASTTKWKDATEKIGSAISSMGRFAQSLGLALAPLSAAFGFGIRQAANFEQQMSALSAVSLGTKEEMDQLTLKAKQLGATTVFSATQAGEAMENMSRAGANVQDIMSGISGVMAAAAADSIPLATSADIISQVVMGLGMSFNEAGRTADVLALASAKTNTDMVGLGEAFKYAASQSRVMKIDLETTATLLGLAADAGLRGSIGGTSYAAMLKKLADPSEAANKWLKANNIEFTKLADGGLDAISVIKQVAEATNKETDVMKKAAIVSELFGDRGQKAFSAIEAGIQSGKIDDLFKQLQSAEGTAAEMARKRLDNMKGAVEMFMGAMEGFAIETAGQFLKPMAATINEVAGAIGKVTTILQRLNAGETNIGALNEEFGATWVAIASGVKEGVETIISVFGQVKKVVMEVVSSITGNAQPNLIKMIAKIVSMGVIIGAMAAPVLIAFGTIMTFISATVVPILTTVAEYVGGALGALSGWGAGILVAFALFRNQGESVWSTFKRVFNGILDLVYWVIDNAITPFADSFLKTVMPYVKALWHHLQTFFYTIREYVAQYVGAIITAFRFLAPFFRGLFSVLGKIVGTYVNGWIMAFRVLLNVLQPVLQIIKSIALWLLENVVNGLLLMVQGLVKLADSLGKADWVPAGMREFAQQGKFSIQNHVASAEFNAIGQPTVADDKSRADQVSTLSLRKEGAKGKPPKVNVDLKLEDKRELKVETCTKIDGREVALANGRATQEIYERSGFKATPWQRRAIAEQGAVPVGGIGSA